MLVALSASNLSCLTTSEKPSEEVQEEMRESLRQT
jgi:hypothetical protein